MHISGFHYEPPPGVLEGKNIFLYNLHSDPNEEQELSAQHKDVVINLLRHLAEYHRTAVAPQQYTVDYEGANPSKHGGAWMPWQQETNNASSTRGDYILVTAILTICFSIFIVKVYQRRTCLHGHPTYNHSE